MYGEYCYYIKGEGKDRVRGNETSIYPEFLKPNTNIGVGNLPLNGVISDNRTYPGKTASVVLGTKRAPELMNMDLGAISARQSAPTDGRDPIGSGGFYTSKQNSDANGMKYQWGRKEPFTFATSSEYWGSTHGQTGKYPVKIYTIDGVLIYQENRGRDNKDKQPAGGIIVSSTMATSMMEAIKNPITFYGEWGAVINQVGHTRSLYDYYWTSYSRGVDGIRMNLGGNPLWHNNYLDGYVSQRFKSIYDPCPYGFKIPSHGIYKQFIIKIGWLRASYIGGVQVKQADLTSWFSSSGMRYFVSSVLQNTGVQVRYITSTPYSQSWIYTSLFNCDATFYLQEPADGTIGLSVRCIEDCDPQSDASPMSIFRFKS